MRKAFGDPGESDTEGYAKLKQRLTENPYVFNYFIFCEQSSWA